MPHARELPVKIQSKLRPGYFSLLAICLLLTLNVSIAGQSIILSDTALEFTAAQTGSLPVSQNFVFSSSDLSHSLSWSLSYDSTWLTVSPASGTDSLRQITVSVNTSDLPIDVYTDVIVIASPDADNSPRRVTVQYEVTALTDQLGLNKTSLAFTAAQTGSLPVTQNFVLYNASSSHTLDWSLSYDSTWLTVGPTSGTDIWRQITIGINTTDLPTGSYSDTIVIETIDAANSPRQVTVQYEVTELTDVLDLSDTALVFTAPQDGPLPVTQNFLLFNASTSHTLDWSLNYDSTWLTVGPTSGTDPWRQITVGVNSTDLPQGIYNDVIVIETIDAANSPRQVTVQYEVVEPLDDLLLSDTALEFTAHRNGSLPVTQNFLLSSSDLSHSLNWSLSYDSTWLTVSPGSGIDSWQQITVGVNTTSLPIDGYSDLIVITSPEAGNSPRQVTVQYEVTQSPYDLLLSDTALEFTAAQNDSLPVTQNFVLSCSDLSHSLNWSLSYDSTWLTVSPGSGIDSWQQITVGVNTTSLPIDGYSDLIVITSPEAGNSPKQVSVQYEVNEPPGCCGKFIGGLTGNADCSDDGRRNLSDITRTIDRVYISKADLCCEENGNIDGDSEGKINLADITRLIDHVYISKAETAACE